MVLFPESKSGALVVAKAAEYMDGDQATKAVLGGVFPQPSAAKLEYAGDLLVRPPLVS